MQITARSKYDLEAVTSLCRLRMFRKSNPQSCFILWIAIFSLLLLLLIVTGIFANDFSALWSEIPLFSLLFLWFFFFYFAFPRIQYKNLSQFADIDNTFVFTDDRLYFSSANQTYSDSSTMAYTMIYRVYETSAYFFIYQNRTQCIIVDKSTLQGGTAFDIRYVLSSYLGKKYVLCRY